MKYKYTPSLQASQEYNMIITRTNSRCTDKWTREYKDESSSDGHNQFASPYDIKLSELTMPFPYRI